MSGEKRITLAELLGSSEIEGVEWDRFEAYNPNGVLEVAIVPSVGFHDEFNVNCHCHPIVAWNGTKIITHRL